MGTTLHKPRCCPEVSDVARGQIVFSRININPCTRFETVSDCAPVSEFFGNEIQKMARQYTHSSGHA